MVLLSGPLRAIDCAPTKVLKIVTVDASPSTSKAELASQPKTLYRRGARYARIEELPDRQNRIHGLIIVAAPDSWMINLADRSARHMVDPDPEPVVKIPAFNPPDRTFPKELSALELGCEDAFFSGYKSPYTELKRDGSVFYKQAVGFGDWKVVLVRRSKGGVPDMLFLFKDEQIRTVLKFISYEAIEKPDPLLFQKPDGLTTSEAGPP